MTGQPFTVQTFNGHDEVRPVRAATFVGLQERGPVMTGAGLATWYPAGLQEALAWDQGRFRVEDKGKVQLHGSGRSMDSPNTTPPRWALWVAGVLDGEHRVAVINTHLVNNAWGPVIRGERVLRRKLWWTGWVKVLILRRTLRRKGYEPFLLGDFNRTERNWHSKRNVLGRGFDRLFYPAAVALLRSWTGDPNGSDHRPLFGEFRFKADR